MVLAPFLINIDTIPRNLLLNITRQVEAHQQLNALYQKAEEEVASRQRARRAAARNTGTASSSAPHNFLAQQNDSFEATEPTAGGAGLGRAPAELR